MTSTMEWIRRTYDVPARHGMRIEYDGKPATITGASNGGLVLRVEGERYKVYTHPCYRIVYPAVPEPVRPRGWCKHCMQDRAMRDGLMGNHRWGGKGWSEPCPGSGKPPWKPVRNQTHPGEQRPATDLADAVAEHGAFPVPAGPHVTVEETAGGMTLTFTPTEAGEGR